MPDVHGCANLLRLKNVANEPRVECGQHLVNIWSTFAHVYHMFILFARAWGKSVLSEFAKYCASNGVKFQDLHRVGTTFWDFLGKLPCFEMLVTLPLLH